MAKKSGLGQQMYISGYDLSGDVGAINNVGSPVSLLDVTPISASGVERIIGRRDGHLNFTAFFNDASGAEHEALKDLPTTDVLALYLMGTTLGDACAALTSKQVGYDATRGEDGSLTFSVDCQGTAGQFLEWGIVLTSKITADDNGDTETGINFGSQTTDGAVGFLQAFACASGTGEYDIDDSSDSTNGVDGSWATLLSFTNVAAAAHPTAERVAVNGTVEKWTRALMEGTYGTAVYAMGLRRRESFDVDAA